MATGAAARTLAELFYDRFILGLGVSAGPFMIRNGLKYAKPVTFMRDYLAGIKTGPFKAPLPHREPPIVIAGLLPKMLRLGAEASDGIITALIPPPAHIARCSSVPPFNKYVVMPVSRNVWQQVEKPLTIKEK